MLPFGPPIDVLTIQTASWGRGELEQQRLVYLERCCFSGSNSVDILWHVGDDRFFAGRKDNIDHWERDDGRDGCSSSSSAEDEIEN